ncbi:hypothetical protein MAPG_07854 [Magnaporthiopsis poae ATCC 64411]|uniref:F-box domain-containing protein n=1 Tax=Magnaporthiopsis poae (strain ATCC 64411 / 73-15) TaxID=644358 RepID=A0A0C4E5S9_MAGP6|nr:hypothetical protein MAPG_07854 [Magnaporthiopsis poae ATCC 64411]
MERYIVLACTGSPTRNQRSSMWGIVILHNRNEWVPSSRPRAPAHQDISVASWASHPFSIAFPILALNDAFCFTHRLAISALGYASPPPSSAPAMDATTRGASRSPMHSLSAELLVQILASCTTFSDLASLILSCKHVHSLWTCHAPAVIWGVGHNCVPAFRYALMAVRATGVVRSSLEAGVMPPNITEDLDAMSSKKPSLEELRLVLDLQHLARCVNSLYWKGICLPWGWRSQAIAIFDSTAPMNLPESVEWDASYRENFHRAIYKVLLAGAALTPPHLRLFSDAEPGQPFCLRPDFPKSLAEYAVAQGPLVDSLLYDPEYEDEVFEPLLAQDAIRYLQTLPAFNPAATLAEQDQVYGPLASFFMRMSAGDLPLSSVGKHDSAPAHVRNTWNSILETYIGNGSPEEAIFQWEEARRMLCVFELISRSICNEDGWLAHSRSLETESDFPVRQVRPGWARSTWIILLDVCRPEQIQMPADPSEIQIPADSSDCGRMLVSLSSPTVNDEVEPRSVSAGSAQGLLKTLDMVYLKDCLYSRSGIPNRDSDWVPFTPPHLQLFDFILRRHFGQRLDGRMVLPDMQKCDDHDYSAFLADASLFTDATYLARGSPAFCARDNRSVFHPPSRDLIHPDHTQENPQPGVFKEHLGGTRW